MQRQLLVRLRRVAGFVLVFIPRGHGEDERGAELPRAAPQRPDVRVVLRLHDPDAEVPGAEVGGGLDGRAVGGRAGVRVIPGADASDAFVGEFPKPSRRRGPARNAALSSSGVPRRVASKRVPVRRRRRRRRRDQIVLQPHEQPVSDRVWVGEAIGQSNVLPVKR
eukprot:31331-Pelagococcus_subviridis.AAC.9